MLLAAATSKKVKSVLAMNGKRRSMYIRCISDVYEDAYQRYKPEATFINLSLWASSVFGFATSPRGFAPREAVRSSLIVSYLQAYSKRILETVENVEAKENVFNIMATKLLLSWL